MLDHSNSSLNLTYTNWLLPIWIRLISNIDERYFIIWMDSFSGHLKLTYRYEGHILCWYINQIWSTKIKFKKTKNYKRRKNHNFCIHIVYIKCIYMNEWIIRCSRVLFCLFFCVLLIRWLTKAQIIHTLFNLIKSIHKYIKITFVHSFMNRIAKIESRHQCWAPAGFYSRVALNGGLGYVFTS